ncbi:DUF3291 domain-containing protein [Streptomyces cocklensis]|jgi:hypothetical protein|uniref:DUF3291 domain-containing protein n=1 Tax=Actinacidiphila cocklensis TaxID=887465 RepID=A0A9W4DII7_9ACTN|nr:DUF3291 domain-containing protein [Actinacidiphila cocklensis]MDD1058674.1 DUF3291 domain-containing protein [Actinacidiphila cocklensis]WSX75120.1 DUF3291 domain-containing protein [Streptomyces sp. NBC_00899]CAG6390860.1 conserved hypothetical protein [Actinacidiphila cocklensis]
MTGFHVAQVNVGRIVAPLDGPELADFVAQLPEINALADHAPGFVWRLVDDGGADSTGLRPDDNDGRLLINCSTWESVEALEDFAYHTDHLRVLSRRREWFQRMEGPHQALWWVPAGHRPSVAEAMERIAILGERGSGPDAFTFRDRYPAPAAIS